MVELEQLGQPVRVLLAALQPVEVADQPVDQDLRPAGQVDEHGRDGRPQGGLLGRGPDSLQVDGVERLGHLAELVLAAHRQRLGDLVGQLHRGELPGDLRVAQPGHRLRQAVLGHREGALAQVAQRAGHRAGDQVGEEDRQQQHAQQQAGLQEDLALHVRTKFVGLLDHVAVELRLDGTDQLGVADHRGVPLVRTEGEARQCPGLVAGDLPLVGGHLAQVAPGDGLLVELLLGPVGDGREGLDRLLLGGDGGDVVRAQGLVESAAVQREVHDHPTLGEELLAAGDGGGGAHPVAQVAVAGELGARVTDRKQLADQAVVPLGREAARHLAVEDLTAGAGQVLKVLVDPVEDLLQRGGQLLQHDALLRVLPVRLVDLLARLGVDVGVPGLGLRLVGTQQQHGGGPLVLQLVDQIT
ncbi:hypothetical protein B0E53_06743 [Micromonospora sp. MH33]|nr:hypothetical protein B0E53_06743 [Micromonospora sp. MH33]